LDYTAIKMLSECPRSYELSLIHRPIPSSAMYLGSVFHSVQQVYFDTKLVGEELTMEDLQDVFNTCWAEGMCEQEIDWNRDLPDNLAVLGQAMVKAYYPYAQRIQPLLVEQVLERETEHALVYGKLDLITADAIVVDFKTSAWAPKKANVDDSLQPTVYSFLLGGPTNYQEHYIVKWRVPKVMIISTPRNKRQINDFQNIILPGISRMVQSGIFPALGRVNGRCKWCSVKGVC